MSGNANGAIASLPLRLHSPKTKAGRDAIAFFYNVVTILGSRNPLLV
ncbi:hypothetical protein NDI37_03575 [Funiculus sociatus GB2-A5]|uniref:Uncharacterized protein n=1 Tax=Funiculus sociatus GB2-A5 TaxID=2933946 RepID=A0ABV0JKL6_9CYAN|nr:hypothetical protein [Trichocoleus sp. FACHB-6]MBD2061622.1 hypothetical protein [Trichocoleus sp. FACHB-6]